MCLIKLHAVTLAPQRSVLEIQRNLDITNDFLYPNNSKIYKKGTPI